MAKFAVSRNDTIHDYGVFTWPVCVHVQETAWAHCRPPELAVAHSQRQYGLLGLSEWGPSAWQRARRPEAC